MPPAPSDGGPPGGRGKALGVVAAAAPSATYRAGLHHRIFSRHAAHSLRRGSARRSQDRTGRRGGSGVAGGTQGGLRHRTASRHAIHSLRRGSARRSQKSTGRLGGSGAVGDALGVIGHLVVMLPAPSDGGPPGGRRATLGVEAAAALSVALGAVFITGQHPGWRHWWCTGPSWGTAPPCHPLPQTGVRPEVAE